MQQVANIVLSFMKQLLLILITLLIISGCSQNERLNRVQNNFGENYNAIRKEFSLVPVDSSLHLTENIENSRYIFVHEYEKGIKHPAYLYKTILLDSAGLHETYEEDLFTNPGEEKYLVLTHNFVQNKTTIEIQGNSENLAANHSVEIQKDQADSILRKWNVHPNPFN